MAFETYQCEQYKKYLLQHLDTIDKIYDLISSSPFSWTQLGAVIGVDYYGFKRRINLKLLTPEQIIMILDYIK